jgi:hypothetical protein
MLGRAPDGIIAPSGLLTRPARTKPSTCQHVTGERTKLVGDSLLVVARRSVLFEVEHHAFFAPHRLAEYLFNLDQIHRGTYSGGGEYGGGTPKPVPQVLNGARRGPGNVVVLKRRGTSRPRAVAERQILAVERSGYPPTPMTPEKFEAVRRRREENGQLGERFVLRHEQDLLRHNGRSDLADAVSWVALEDVSLGYDIKSFWPDGSDKFIEVKSTQGDAATFDFTANEWTTADRERENYVIARVIHVRTGPAIREIRDPVGLFEAGVLSREPSAWRIRG